MLFPKIDFPGDTCADGACVFESDIMSFVGGIIQIPSFCFSCWKFCACPGHLCRVMGVYCVGIATVVVVLIIGYRGLCLDICCGRAWEVAKDTTPTNICSW